MRVCVVKEKKSDRRRFGRERNVAYQKKKTKSTVGYAYLHVYIIYIFIYKREK